MNNKSQLVIVVLGTIVFTFTALALLGMKVESDKANTLTKKEIAMNRERNRFIDICSKNGVASKAFCGCSYDYLSGKGENYLDVRDNSPKLWDKWLGEAVEVCLPFAN